MGFERKFYQTSLVDASLTAPADSTGGEHDPSATIMLNTVTQGDGESQRNGHRMRMQSLEIQGRVQTAAKINQTAADLAPTCFVAVVHDSQTNAAQLNSEDVFINGGANANLAAMPQRNLQFIDRFRVLKQWRVSFPTPDAVYDGTNIEIAGQSKYFNWRIPLKNMKVTFKGTTETVANITDNSLHVVAFCDNVGAAPKLSYQSRLRFTG